MKSNAKVISLSRLFNNENEINNPQEGDRCITKNRNIKIYQEGEWVEYGPFYGKAEFDKIRIDQFCSEVTDLYKGETKTVKKVHFQTVSKKLRSKIEGLLEANPNGFDLFLLTGEELIVKVEEVAIDPNDFLEYRQKGYSIKLNPSTDTGMVTRDEKAHLILRRTKLAPIGTADEKIAGETLSAEEHEATMDFIAQLQESAKEDVTSTVKSEFSK